ncbi:XK-related protein 6 [Nephila pilipes]|uniref:XK-related protein n=1 Tax=Nephila pilipes TaxID=299642 RepID=A0A8X6PVN2_NEPPI|nr:XK-related protein 6 [Nephila pilipes]
MDIFFIILSIGSFLADIGTDFIVIFQYFKNEHFIWFTLTMSLVCLPSLIVQIFSIRWYTNDGKVTYFICIVHILQLGLFYRFLQLLLEGLRVRKSKSSSNLDNFNCQQSDICMLRLFESFMESAPQLVLQLYIMISTDDWNLWTGISAIACIISLSWGIAAYSRALRNLRLDKEILSCWGLLFQAVWRIGMVSARIISMVLFAVAYGHWLFLGIGLHWLIMITWIFYQKTDFCTTWWEERLYNCVVGVIYCFCYFNIKEGKARYRMTIYYFITVLENIAAILAFYFSDTSNHNLRHFIALLVPVGMLVGLSCMLLYYRLFHPSGPIMVFTAKQSENKNDIIEDKPENKPNFCTLKTCRKFMEVTEENNDMDLAFSENPLNTDIKKNLNISNISLTFMDKSVLCLKRNLHRSHSFNCSVILYDNHTSHFIRRRKLLASHYRNVNYNFRPAAAFGIVSSKIHCSCLILSPEPKKFNESTVVINDKLSNSLPNLELSFESEENSSLESTHLNNGRTFFNHIMSSGSLDSDIYEPPFINKDDVIRIKVEGIAA